MSNTKVVMSQASNQYVAPTFIEDVFSTYLYTGNGSTQTITNGIDLANEGGLVWIKLRSPSGGDHFLVDTERGVNKRLSSNLTSSENTSASVTAFNSDGFSISSDININWSGNPAASWTFRKAPRFFDVVTYAYQGNASGTTAQIAHNLGVAPGMIIIKAIDKVENPIVWHRNVSGYLKMGDQGTSATFTATGAFGSLTPSMTDTYFTVGYDGGTNFPGYNYVAYLFAHDPLGPSGDGSDGLIACGSYAGNNGINSIDIGWEAQWVLIKSTTFAGEWTLVDVMRGMPVGSNGARLFPNTSGAESVDRVIYPNATGFTIDESADALNGSGQTYIYIAIRRGPMRAPTSGTEVFDVVSQTPDPNLTGTKVTSAAGVVDLVLTTQRSRSGLPNTYVVDRMRGGTKELTTNTTSAENTRSDPYNWKLDYMDGMLDNWAYPAGSVTTDMIYWLFRRAPGFFDVVAYTGTGINGLTLNHNLDAVPEMILVRHRNVSYTPTPWFVYHSALGNTKYLHLNTLAAEATSQFAWNNTSPTDANFTVGAFDGVNGSSGFNYIAYLFATLPGVSKVGSFTATGSVLDIDCGFTSGARFVLIKRTDTTGEWFVFDTARGITISTSPWLPLNTSSGENIANYIDPLPSGFRVTTDFYGSGDFIFYAIA